MGPITLQSLLVRPLRSAAIAALPFLVAAHHAGAALIQNPFGSDPSAVGAYWNNFTSDVNADDNRGPHAPDIGGSVSGITISSITYDPTIASSQNLYFPPTGAPADIDLTIDSTYQGAFTLAQPYRTVLFQLRTQSGVTNFDDVRLNIAGYAPIAATYQKQLASGDGSGSGPEGETSSFIDYAWQFDLTGYDFTSLDFQITFGAPNDSYSVDLVRVDLSGNSYANLIPEPSAGILVLFAGLVFLRRRNRKHLS